MTAIYNPGERVDKIFTTVASLRGGGLTITDGSKTSTVESGEKLTFVDSTTINFVTDQSDNVIANILDDSVTSNKLGTDAVTNDKIADNSVSSTKLANDSVITSKIADNNITAVKLADGAITGLKLTDGSVTTAKLALNSVDSTILADSSVDTAAILDANVTTAKLASNCVTSHKIVDGNVTLVKLNNDALTNLTNIPAANTLDVNSSTGTNTTLPAATTTVAGVMTGTDKAKLDMLISPNFCRVNKSSAQTFTNLTVTELTNYTSSQIDTFGTFDLPEGRYTTPFSGWYKIYCTMSYSGNNSSGDRLACVFLDGANAGYFVEMPAVQTDAWTTTMSYTAVLNIAANVTIGVGGQQSSGGDLNVVSCILMIEYMMPA